MSSSVTASSVRLLCGIVACVVVPAAWGGHDPVRVAAQAGRSPCAAGSGPCIDGVDVASPLAGQVITVTGVDLQQDEAAVAAAHPFFASSPTRHGFEKGGAGEDISNDGYACGNVCGPEEGTDGDGYYDATVRLGGQYATKFFSQSADGACRTPGGCGGSYNYVHHPGEFADDFWVRFAFRLQGAGGWPTHYSKLYYGLGLWYLNFDAAPGSDRIFDSWNFVHGDRNHVTAPAHRERTFVEDRWYWMVCHWKSTRESVYRCEQDGEVVHDASPRDGDSPVYSIFGTINAHSGVRGPAWAFRTWFDNLLVSRERLYPSAVIEACDGPDHAGARCEWQAPVFISDTRVQFVFEPRSLDCEPCYVFVRNNEQELSGGFPLAR